VLGGIIVGDGLPPVGRSEHATSNKSGTTRRTITSLIANCGDGGSVSGPASCPLSPGERVRVRAKGALIPTAAYGQLSPSPSPSPSRRGKEGTSSPLPSPRGRGKRLAAPVPRSSVPCPQSPIRRAPATPPPAPPRPR